MTDVQDSYSPPLIDDDAVSRGVVALGRFVFPGSVVPRREMARAVLLAAAGGEGWLDYLPQKHIVPYVGVEEEDGSDCER